MASPDVSIVLPAKDAAAWLPDALESISQQSFSNWELLLVDDHSQDSTASLVSTWADQRTRLIPATGSGIVAALNQGLAAARAPLIARMDADDIMLPQRLALQVQAFADDHSLTLCASRVQLFPGSNHSQGMTEYLRWQHQCLDHQSLAQHMFLESPFVHPSVMFRRDAVMALGGYQHGPFPEDYDLWLRLHASGASFRRLPDTLLHWRQHPDSLSRTDPRCSRQAFDQLRARHLSRHLNQLLPADRPLVYAGAGPRTRRRARILQRLGHPPTLYLDIDPAKLGQHYDGALVVHPEQLPTQPRPFVLIYVANHGARELVAAQLQAKGLAPAEDYLHIG